MARKSKKKYLWRGTSVVYGFGQGKGREFRATAYGPTRDSALENAEKELRSNVAIRYLSADLDHLDWGRGANKVPKYSGDSTGYREIYVKGYEVKRKGYTRTLKSGKKVKVKGYTTKVKGYYRRVRIGPIEYQNQYVERTYKARREHKGTYPISAEELA
jgi:hypothetical protein